MIKFEKKVLGVLLGTAYGDALGATIEKLTYEEIKLQYGEVSDIRTKWYKAEYPPEKRLNRMRGYGVVTDDTLMTMALVQTYLKERRHLDAWDMGNEFVRQIVYEKRYIPEFSKEAVIQDRLFYPERYIFQRHILANCEPREGGYGNMINCGAAMYIAPVGIVNAGNPKRAYEEAILFACGHQASYGLEAAGVLAACVATAMEPSATIDKVIQTALDCAKDGTQSAIAALTATAETLRDAGIYEQDVVVEKFHEAILPYSPMGDDVDRRMDKLGIASNHYTPSRLFSIEELPIALAYLKLYDGDFKKSIVKAINSGRDTDSIGVMIAVICGALYGDEIISDEDKILLEDVNKQCISETAASFSVVARNIIRKDVEIVDKQKNMLG